MNDDNIATLSDEQLQQNIMSMRRELNGIMTEKTELNARASKINSKLDKLLAEQQRRNYADMIQHFELNADHVKLLRKYGSQVAEITASDLEIAETLGWEVADSGLTERQEENIARLLSELKYAQDYINDKSDDLINAKGPSDVA